MSLTTRFAFLLTAASIMGALAWISLGDWSHRNWVADMGDELDRSRRLDDEFFTMARIRECRLQIARDLQNDSITMEEALRALRLLNKDDQGYWSMLNVVYPECSERELLCFQVLTSIDAVQPPACIPSFNGVLARLERELHSKPMLKLARRMQCPSESVSERSGG